LAVPESRAADLRAAAAACGVAVTRIGRFEEGAADVAVLGPDGAPMALAAGGWSHFA
jgi:thiamine-monophosphate kinase